MPPAVVVSADSLKTRLLLGTGKVGVCDVTAFVFIPSLAFLGLSISSFASRVVLFPLVVSVVLPQSSFPLLPLPPRLSLQFILHVLVLVLHASSSPPLQPIPSPSPPAYPFPFPFSLSSSPFPSPPFHPLPIPFTPLLSFPPLPRQPIHLLFFQPPSPSPSLHPLPFPFAPSPFPSFLSPPPQAPTEVAASSHLESVSPGSIFARLKSVRVGALMGGGREERRG